MFRKMYKWNPIKWIHVCVHVYILYYSVSGKRPWALNHKPSFSPYWVLAQCTGHLQCVKIEIGGVDLWAWRLHARYACTHVRICRLYIEHDAWLFRQSTRDTRAYIQLSLRVGWSYSSESEKDRDRLHHYRLHKCSRRLCHRCDLGSRYVGTCPGVGVFHLNSQNSYMGAYPGVGACQGHYGTIILQCAIVPVGIYSWYNRWGNAW